MPRTSLIDRRLASLLSQRQVDSLSRIDRILGSIAKEFAEAQRDLLSAITGDYSADAKRQALPAVIRSTTGRVKQLLASRFRDHATWGHRSAVDSMMQAIPLPYLLAQIPDETRAAFESIHWPRLTPNLNFEAGMLTVSTEDIDPGPFNATLPINPLGALKLTDEQVAELIEKIVFPPPSESDITAALRTPDWEARLDSLSSRISDKQIAFDQLVQGYSEGENITQIRRRLDPLVGGLRSSAQRIARTEGMRVAETMQRQAWAGLGDMMVGVQIIAVLDERTRPEHATRNGTIYYNSPRGKQKSIAELPDLPDAPNCRCMSSPVLAPPAELEDDPSVREAFKQVKGSGRVDPETYNKWFKTADQTKRKQVVGVRRYREVEQLVGDREPEWSDFIDEDGNLLTIAEILAETMVDRTARKQEIERQMARRGQAIRELSRRGFEWPRKRR